MVSGGFKRRTPTLRVGLVQHQPTGRVDAHCPSSNDTCVPCVCGVCWVEQKAPGTLFPNLSSFQRYPHICFYTQFYQSSVCPLYADDEYVLFKPLFFWGSEYTSKYTHTHTHTSHVAHVHHVSTPVQAILRFVEADAPRYYDCRRRQQPAGPGAAADEVEVAARRGQAVHGQRPLRRLDAEGLVGECPVETATL